MLRIVFVNLHANEFLLKPLSKYIWKQSCAFKHKYFFEYLLNDPDIEVCNYISKDGFTLIRSFPEPLMKLIRPLRFWENRIVMCKNGVPRKNVKVIKKKDIRPDDIVIGYRNISLSDMEQINAFKAVCMLHFHGEQSDSDKIQKTAPNILINESNLGKCSDIFKHYYSWYKGKFLVHPFVAAPRFKRIKPFSERENKCFSTGTITYKLHPEFMEVYGTTCDQPTRKQILANKEELEPWVACYNSDYLEDADMKKYLPTDSIFTHYRKVYYNLRHGGQQKKYFSFDMVEKFNEFKMCLVGEEILGVPGIGFVEGMACGCAYIGQTTGFYEDYGMLAGVHYIGYDGTLEDLKAKIAYYQLPEHQEELERIANAGYEFAQSHFRGEVVAKELLEKLLKAKAEWKASK